MADQQGPIRSLKEALERGFKPISDLTPEFQAMVEAAKAAKRREFAAQVSPCGPGHNPKTPCRDFCYSNGVREVCFCSAANQCEDNCVYSTCPPY